MSQIVDSTKNILLRQGGIRGNQSTEYKWLLSTACRVWNRL